MADKCYVKLKGKVADSKYKLCGPTNFTSPVVPCCADTDSCMSNGLCRYTRSEIGGSGFYAAGCNDASFKNPACPQLCNDLENRDVSWEAPAKRWACCGMGKDNHPSCDNVTKHTFDAPNPNNLKAYWIIGQGVPPPGPTSTISASTTSFSQEPQATRAWSNKSKSGDSSKSQLSSGVAAGIGAGVAAGALLLMAIIILLFLLRRQRKKDAMAASQHTPIIGGSPHAPYTAYNPNMTYMSGPTTYSHLSVSELPHDRTPQELDSKSSADRVSSAMATVGMRPHELPPSGANEARPVTSPQSPSSLYSDPLSPAPTYSAVSGVSGYPTWTPHSSHPTFSPMSPDSSSTPPPPLPQPMKPAPLRPRSSSKV